jgi:hypothetical protein
MKPEGSLPHSLETTICHYPKPDRAIPYPTPLRSILILSSHPPEPENKG